MQYAIESLYLVLFVLLFMVKKGGDGVCLIVYTLIVEKLQYFTIDAHVNTVELGGYQRQMSHKAIKFVPCGHQTHVLHAVYCRRSV